MRGGRAIPSCPTITGPEGERLPPCKTFVTAFFSSADDEHGLIVNTVLFANLAETIVFFHRIFQQGVADFLCRLAIALMHHPSSC